MKTRLTLLLVAISLLVVPTLASAEAPAPRDHERLMQLLGDWTLIAKKDLRLDDAPNVQRTTIAVSDSDVYEVHTAFGGVLSETHRRVRPGMMEVVVGDGEIDSSRFYGAQGAPRRSMNLILDDLEVGIARDLWLASDGSYKAAVAQWRAKSVDRSSQKEEEPPDWTPATPVKSITVVPETPINGEKLRTLAVTASQKLWALGGLEQGEVHAFAVRGHYYLATSEGTRLIQPEGYVIVYATASTTRDDGVVVTDSMHWIARNENELPADREIIKQVEAMGKKVKRRVSAKVVESYEGPVVFEGDAAADFFRYLIPNEVMGTPPPAGPGSTYTQRTRYGPRLGRRLLPSGWAVSDDPTNVPDDLPGGYKYDREGTPAQAVTLVENGYVRNFVMTRVPRAEIKKSNGHARGHVWREWTGRLSSWRVDPDRMLSKRKFARRVSKAQKASGVEKILVVRRLQPGHPGGLPQPSDAVWRYPDGREEPVLTVEFQKVDRRTLRDIAAAGGGRVVRPYLADWSSHFQWRTEPGLPMVVTAPRQLLLEGIEAVYPGPTADPHIIPRPEPASVRSTR